MYLICSYLLSIFVTIEKFLSKSLLIKWIELMKSINTLITNLIKRDLAHARKIC